MDAMKYEIGSCPVAEQLGEKILNLPTGLGVTIEDAKKVAELVLD